MTRRFPLTLLALTLAAGPAFASEPCHSGAGHHHDHQHHPQHGADKDQPGSVSVDGDRWASDAPLREGMRRMREAMEGLSRHESDGLAGTQVHELATAVDEALAFMFANCELEPEPDHALHLILAQLMVGSRALHANPSDSAPVASMRVALEDYARQFDDPDLPAPGSATR